MAPNDQQLHRPVSRHGHQHGSTRAKPGVVHKHIDREHENPSRRFVERIKRVAEDEEMLAAGDT